jgi:LysM repeat protein
MRKYWVAMLATVLLGGGVISAKVIGRVDGFPITERDANAFLRVVTKGKLKYHQLRAKDKKDVIKRLATDALLVGMAKKKLPKQERNQVIVNYWLSKKIQKVTIEESEIKKAYTENKKFFKGTKGEILPYEKVKEMVLVSLKQKKYVAQLMNKAKITMGKKVIKSPKSSKKSSSKKSKKSDKKVTAKGIYVVQGGNTLSGIAHKYHITISQLRTLNKMSKKDVLKVGQKLKVPSK